MYINYINLKNFFIFIQNLGQIRHCTAILYVKHIQNNVFENIIEGH